ncbi:MAG: hypothetical protein CR982_07010 [Candidatus Cloacimonadota bacterium]|nr:MAG: hypothetical protein CR982_07010 [Candidatus Cloacimonadota bacterium]PIE80652.1 MAG: hypothetical protein CSA15_01755 [Candidatus Delongbacteria bacterium]
MWENTYGTNSGTEWAGRSFWVCTENWENQNYPISVPLYNNIGGFDNGYVPMFGIIGKDYKVYYNSNSTNFEQQLKLAMNGMYDSAAPLAPSNFSVTPDGEGALSVDLSWTNPSQTIGQAPLPSISNINLYLDGELVNSFESPEVGAEMSYTDNSISEEGLHIYKIQCVNEAGKGIPCSKTVYIGEDAPGMVTGLNLVDNNGVADLSWTNPMVGAHNGYYVENSITSYTITRNDGEEFTLEGMTTSFSDNSITLAGNYSYTVVANNNVGAGLEAVSNTVSFIPNSTLLLETFENFPPEGWTVQGENWRASYANYAGGTAPEAKFGWSPQTVGDQYLITRPLDTSGKSSISIAFNNMIDYYGPGYECKIVTSTDMENWEVAHTFPGQDIGPELFSTEISNDHVGSETFYLAFMFSGDSYQINDWYIDDVSIALNSSIDEFNSVKEFTLSQNYPNPFNPTTTISFNTSSRSAVNLAVFNSNGELVSTLVDKDMSSGYHSVEFNAESLNSGVYFYKLSVNGISETKKMILVK